MRTRLALPAVVVALTACDRGPSQNTRPVPASEAAVARSAAPHSPASHASPGNTVSNHAPTDDALVTLAVTRIRASAVPRAPIVVFVSAGTGTRTERAVEALRSALARVPSITVATPAQGSVMPWPTIVVRVSESESNPSLFISARAPGRDPLGAADEGWAWVLSSP